MDGGDAQPDDDRVRPVRHRAVPHAGCRQHRLMDRASGFPGYAGEWTGAPVSTPYESDLRSILERPCGNRCSVPAGRGCKRGIVAFELLHQTALDIADEVLDLCRPSQNRTGSGLHLRGSSPTRPRLNRPRRRRSAGSRRSTRRKVSASIFVEGAKSGFPDNPPVSLGKHRLFQVLRTSDCGVRHRQPVDLARAGQLRR